MHSFSLIFLQISIWTLIFILCVHSPIRFASPPLLWNCPYQCRYVDNNMEEGLLKEVILLDVRKAFGLVNTNVLLHKLKIYQCNEITIDWFKSYLQSKCQCVSFKGKLSDVKTVTHGIPQWMICYCTPTHPLICMQIIPPSVPYESE